MTPDLSPLQAPAQPESLRSPLASGWYGEVWGAFSEVSEPAFKDLSGGWAHLCFLSDVLRPWA